MVSRSALLRRVDTILGTPEAAACALLVVRVCRHADLRIEHGYAVTEAIDQAAELLIDSLLRPGDCACRVSAGVYALMLQSLRHENHALLAVSRLQRAFQGDLLLDETPVRCLIAVGLTQLDQHPGSAEHTLRDVDIAAATAEREGLALKTCKSGESSDALSAQALGDAISSNQLQAWMQPLWDLRNDRMVGAESLARWHSTSLGWVSAARFIALAEQSALIGDLTRWSLNASLHVCQQMRMLDPAAQVAVNLSPLILLEDDLVENVLAALRLWDVPPSSLVLEITEGAIMRNPGSSGRMIERLFDAGIGIALDDFGSGYSSFGYLREFPASELKIDRSFVTGLTRDARSRQLARSMIDLAHNLGMLVVAEGVEDEPTLDLLRHLGCDRAQGYFISAPLPSAEFLALLAAQQGLPATIPAHRSEHA
jgi:diguanylate cyclase